MSVATGQTVTVDFVVRNPATGAMSNADALPTGVLVVNGTDNAATVTVANKATGRYKASVTMPTLATGDGVELVVAATSNGVADADVLWCDRCDATVASRAAGSPTVFVAYGVSDAASGTALAAAISAAGAGTRVLAGAGTFAFGTTRVTIPAGVTVEGLGQGVTILTTAVASGTGVLPSSGSAIRSLRLRGTAGAAQFGVASGDATATAVEATDVTFEGSGSTAGGSVEYGAGAAASWRFARCTFLFRADGIAVSTASAADLDVDLCRFVSTGQSGTPNVDALTFTSSGLCTVRSCTFVTRTASGNSRGVRTSGVGGVHSPRVFLDRCTLMYEGGGGPYVPIANTIGTIVADDCVFDPSLVTGTVTVRNAHVTHVAPAALTAAAIADGAFTAAKFAAAFLSAAKIDADALLAIANKVEQEIIDETDPQKVLTAFTDRIAAANPDLSGLTVSVIAAGVWQYLVANATTAGSIGERLAENLDAAVSSRLTIAILNADAAQATARTNAASAAADASTIKGQMPSLGAQVAAQGTVNTLNTSLNGLIGKFTGVTFVRDWWRAIVRKSAPDATAAAEIGGTFDPTVDSLEARADQATQDAATTSGQFADVVAALATRASEATAEAARDAAEAASEKAEELLDAVDDLDDDLIAIANGVVGTGEGVDALLGMTTGVGATRAFRPAALANAPAGGGGEGESAAAIWQHPERTLTSFPPGYTLSLPQPGVGAFIAGGRREEQATAFRLVAIAGSTVTLMARVVGVDRDYINRSKVATIWSSVANVQEVAAPDVDTHAVADVVYDALQIDAGWTEDAYGFNLAVPISGDRIGQAGTTYRIDVRLTDDEGRPIVLRWDVQTT